MGVLCDPLLGGFAARPNVEGRGGGGGGEETDERQGRRQRVRLPAGRACSRASEHDGSAEQVHTARRGRVPPPHQALAEAAGAGTGRGKGRNGRAGLTHCLSAAEAQDVRRPDGSGRGGDRLPEQGDRQEAGHGRPHQGAPRRVQGRARRHDESLR